MGGEWLTVGAASNKHEARQVVWDHVLQLVRSNLSCSVVSLFASVTAKGWRGVADYVHGIEKEMSNAGRGHHSPHSDSLLRKASA